MYNKVNLNPKLDSMVSVLNELEKNNLIYRNNLFLIRLKQFPVSFVYPDKTKEYYLVKSIVERYTKVYEIDFNCLDYKPVVYEFDTINEEVVFVFNNIIDLLNKGIELDKIYIAGANEDYIYLFKRLANTYNITIEFPNVKNTREYLRREILYRVYFAGSSTNALDVRQGQRPTEDAPDFLSVTARDRAKDVR